jgi:predicted Zn-dependent protease with MMP-like domain
MNRMEFEALVAEVIDAFPPQVMSELDNVAICVEKDSEDGDKLGEYIGVAQIERDSGYSGVAPDRIVLYQAAIEDECDSAEREVIREEIRRTLWHEIAHHLGWEEDALHEAETRRGWREEEQSEN